LYNRELEVLRTSERARNFHALYEVRDQRTNQAARVHAVNSLMSMEEPVRTGAQSITAGITINIVSAAPANGSNAKVIDAVRDTTKLDCEPSD
jgi:hypothetical protein